MSMYIIYNNVAVWDDREAVEITGFGLNETGTKESDHMKPNTLYYAAKVNTPHCIKRKK